MRGLKRPEVAMWSWLAWLLLLIADGISEHSERPWCEMHSPNTPVAGFLSQGNLVLDAGCRYRLFDGSHAATCLEGKWIAVMGSSNALLQFNNLVNFLARDEYFVDREGELIGASAVVDVVIKDGKVRHWATVPNHVHECHQVALSEQESRWPSCRQLIREIFSKVPENDGTSIRLTFFTSFFWKRTELALRLIEDDTFWKAADFGLVTQIGAWYKNCCFMKFKYCPRQELLAYDIFAEGGELFKAEMEESLSKLQSFCAPGGRAEHLGCNIQTISYTNGPRDKKVFGHLNQYITQAMEQMKTPKFRIVDFFALGQGMPEEVYGDHASQMLNVWGWVVQLNTFCPERSASTASYAAWSGAMCSGMEARYEKCPKYYHKCSAGHTCEKWECMNSVPCTFSAHHEAPHTFGSSAGLCEEPVDASSFLAQRQQHGPWHPSWYNDKIDWLVVLVTVLMAVGLKCWFSQQSEPSTEPQIEQKLEQTRSMFIEIAEQSELLQTTGQEAKIAGPTSEASTLAREDRAESETSPFKKSEELKVRFELDGEAGQIRLPAAGEKYPLGLARFLASSHVVVGHLFAKGVTAPIYFFHWGFSWVPWFFMLSGFVLFSAFLKGSRKEETMVQYVLRRSTTIYPLYAFALLLAFISVKIRGAFLRAQWPTLLAECFLMQSWVPYFTENALQMHCWFLSCLVVYWFFFQHIALCFKDLSLMQTCALMGFFFSLPWLIVLVPAILHDQEDWYKEHDFYETDTFLDFGVVMLKYHPFCYVHVFLLGMLLAKLRQLLDKHAKACKEGCFSWRNPYVLALQFVAPSGYLALLSIFSIKTFHAKTWGYKLAARIAVLLPFQAMILFGLAGLPSLPLPFFSHAFSQLDFLERYSYTVYIFQFLLYDLWPKSGQVNLPLFLIFVYSASYIIANCIQQPIQRWWTSNERGRLVVPFALAAFFMAGDFCRLQLPGPTMSADLPRMVRDNGSLDVRLKFRDLDGHPDSSIINPSLLVKDDELMVVARRHRREVKQHSGVYDGPDGSWDAVIIEEIWHSDIVMGRVKLQSDALEWNHFLPANGSLKKSPFPEVSLSTLDVLRTEDDAPWKDLCVVERWIPQNRTLMRMIVTGPEDPKVVTLGSKILLAFDSHPPKSSGRCRKNSHGSWESVPQMYLATLDSDSAVKAYRLQHGSADLAEKNWIPFVHSGGLHFVYTPLPHYVIAAHLDGSSSDTIYSTTHGPLHQLRKEQLEIRGSAQAVFVNAPKLTAHLPRPHYLALMHIFDPLTRRYGHFAYRFQTEPPFTILQVSSQLPLSEAAAMPSGVPFAFASGLTVKGSAVVVTYGAGDRESRALVMTLEKLDDLFRCST